MLLGKRPRPSVKRTTSMSEITLDLNTTTKVGKRSGGIGFSGLDQSHCKLVVPRNQKTCSSDFVDTHDFLRACSLCKRRLVPGHDIYMYRGDSGFCSLECRQQQINHDERKEKYLVSSKKQVVATQSRSKSKVTTTTTTKGETTVVAL